MSDDFAYVNARVRGLRGALLPAGEIRTLLLAPDLNETVKLLGKTPYGRDIQSALAGRPGIEGVEEGFRLNVERSFSRLVGITTGTVREMIRVVLGRWETDCLKALVRGKLRHATAGEILASCLPVGIFDEASLRELARQEDVTGVLNLLRLWGYPPARRLQRSWKRRPRPEELQELEVGIDRSFLGEALLRLGELGSPGDVIRSFLRLEIDFRNVLTALRLVQASSPAKGSSFFLPGGRLLSRDSFTRLSGRPDVAAAVTALGESPLSPPFRKALPDYRSSGRLSLFERAVYRVLFSESRRVARREPLGAGLAAGYIWSKVNEVTNLRLVCRGVHIGLPRQDLEAELTLATP